MFTVYNTLKRFGLCGLEPDQVIEQYEPQLAEPMYAPQSSRYPYVTHRGLIEENPNYASSSPKSKSEHTQEGSPKSTRASQEGSPPSTYNDLLGANSLFFSNGRVPSNFPSSKSPKPPTSPKSDILSTSQKELHERVDKGVIRKKKGSKKTNKQTTKVRPK